MSILNTSVSGMSADSNWLSSISQNVANANTTGYKNSETHFSALVDQVSSGTASGQGVQAGALSLNALQGNIVSSQTATNLAVQGSGFFVVSNAAGDLYLTRDGSFVADAAGDLVNSDGYYLMGGKVASGQSTASAHSLSSLERVSVDGAGLKAQQTTSGSLSANLPAAATTSADSPQNTSFVAYDDLGAAHTIKLQFSYQGSDTWGLTATDAATGNSVGSATLAFNATGGLQSVSPPASTSETTAVALSGSPLSSGQSITLDLSAMTQLATGFTVTSATANGSAPGSLSSVSIAADGTMSYNYSNGASVSAYDIPLASVASPDNLTSVNGNAYTSSAKSGPIFLGSANSGGFGAIESSSLESSTVDLATELTGMIQAQSAYQANSKVFQTGATLLDILNNLKA